ncbi:MAG: PspC domain-containing protein [bacterium]|nr:PspC domain-containing protein [bacterium]
MEQTTQESHPVKQLRRSRTNRMVTGVCGGIGAYFSVDPVLVRVVFVILGLVNGFGFLLYLALTIIVPREPGAIPADDTESKVRAFAGEVERRADALGAELQKEGSGVRRVVMWVVIVLAVAALIGLLRPRAWGWGMAGGWYPFGMHGGWGVFLPLILVFVGLYLIIRPPRK